MAHATDVKAPGTTAGGGRPRLGLGADGTSSPAGLMIKIGALGLLLAVAVWAAVPLVGQQRWIWLAVLVLVTALAFYVYLSPRTVPLKYLLPGTLFLIVFQILPVLYTVSTAFTNFGDGHRGTKQEAIAAIEASSVQQVPDGPVYTLTYATDGPAAAGDLVLLLTDAATDTVYAGTADGLTELPAGDVQRGDDGRISSASGYTVLSLAEIGARQDEIATFGVPAEGGTIKGQGLNQAFVGAPRVTYDAGCDCVTDTEGKRWTADDENGSFVDETGSPLAQGWQVNVGLRNFGDVLSNPTIRASFLRIVVWNFAFAFLTVAITFGLGLVVALALNNPLLKGKTVYRSLIILPYAMPVVAMYLVWRDMFNTDFGLINKLLGTQINWLGSTGTSMIAILLVQMWLGYNYMFLVITGALQSIPSDLTEAAGVDGARPFYAFRTITFPLLLVALAPLLIASFAFNFNNFSGIFLVTQGGPFPPDNPSAGGTDILITYTYRLAFGGSGAQYGFAAAISVFIFLIVAIFSIVSFRRTHALEEIN